MSTQLNRENYATRKEYRWARRNAKRRVAARTRPVRYFIAVASVTAWVITGSFVAFAVTFLVCSLAYAAWRF